MVTQSVGVATAVKHYDDKGFLITATADLSSQPSPSGLADVKSSSVQGRMATSTQIITNVSATGTSAACKIKASILSAAFAILGGLLLL